MHPLPDFYFDHEKLVAYLLLVAKRKCTAEQIQSGKAILRETVCLLVGLVRTISPDRLREEPGPYGSRGEAGTPEPAEYE